MCLHLPVLCLAARSPGTFPPSNVPQKNPAARWLLLQRRPWGRQQRLMLAPVCGGRKKRKRFNTWNFCGFLPLPRTIQSRIANLISFSLVSKQCSWGFLTLLSKSCHGVSVFTRQPSLGRANLTNVVKKGDVSV